MTDAWVEAQKWEADWWGTCANTFGEEAKQITYAHRMGLVNVGQSGGYWPLYDLAGRNVLDLGGGPVSMLLKCINLGRRCRVVDPGDYPAWIHERYAAAGIAYTRAKAERSRRAGSKYDEAWLYNVLQHVEDPQAVVARAREAARTVRIFEWVDLPPYQGHLHTLTQLALDRWLNTVGTVEVITENGIEAGKAYYAVADGS